MKIACLGWGSLIWNPKELLLEEKERPWHRDGPLLPVEFARKSLDGRLTLVIVFAGKQLPVLWAQHALTDLHEARANLCAREWRNGDPQQVVGVWQRGWVEQSLHIQNIATWAEARDFDAVIWTKLPPRFANEERVPSLDETLAYLRRLSRDERQAAEEYIRRTPSQIRTPYRIAIEREMGWAYDASVTEPNIECSSIGKNCE